MRLIKNPITVVVLAHVAGFYIGYQWPRDLEIESTKPIVFNYEITPEAAKILVFKYAEDQGTKP